MAMDPIAGVCTTWFCRSATATRLASQLSSSACNNFLSLPPSKKHSVANVVLGIQGDTGRVSKWPSISAPGDAWFQPGDILWPLGPCSSEVFFLPKKKLGRPRNYIIAISPFRKNKIWKVFPFNVKKKGVAVWKLILYDLSSFCHPFVKNIFT